jgi:hypothetical protein
MSFNPKGQSNEIATAEEGRASNGIKSSVGEEDF